MNDSFVKYPQESLQFMLLHPYHETNYQVGFTEYEVNSMKNLIEWFKMPIESHRKDYLRVHFAQFYSEHDKRRDTQSAVRVQSLLE